MSRVVPLGVVLYQRLWCEQPEICILYYNIYPVETNEEWHRRGERLYSLGSSSCWRHMFTVFHRLSDSESCWLFMRTDVFNGALAGERHTVSHSGPVLLNWVMTWTIQSSSWEFIFETNFLAFLRNVSIKKRYLSCCCLQQKLTHICILCRRNPGGHGVYQV